MAFENTYTTLACGCVECHSEHDFFSYTHYSVQRCEAHAREKEEENQMQEIERRIEQEEMNKRKAEEEREKKKHDELKYRNLKEIEIVRSENYTPICYAIECFKNQPHNSSSKLNSYISRSDLWIKKHLIKNYAHILQISKVKNRWVCNKDKVNMINFALIRF